jgi:quercetin dioxygenase-like cupin family protein
MEFESDGMSATYRSEAPRQTISSSRERYLTHTDHLMMVVLDFSDGPGTQPDPPHHHPHEQITYVAQGRVLFFLGSTAYELSEGDMIAVPPDVPHSIQLLTPSVRLVDTFNPLREDFLEDGDLPLE